MKTFTIAFVGLAAASILLPARALADSASCAPWQKYTDSKPFRCDGPNLYLNDGTGDAGWKNCGGQKIICGAPNPCLDPKKLGI